MTKITFPTLAAQVRRSRRSLKPYTRDWAPKEEADGASDDSAKPLRRVLAVDAMKAARPTFTVTTPAPLGYAAPRRADSEALIALPQGRVPEGEAYLLKAPAPAPAGAAQVAAGVACTYPANPLPPPPACFDALESATSFAVRTDAHATAAAHAAGAVAALPGPTPPNIVSLTPDGNAWWKLGPAQPGNFSDVYLEPHQLLRRIPILLDSAFQAYLHAAAHGGRAPEVYALLVAKDRQVEHLVAAFRKLSAPTLEQMHAASDVQAALSIFRAHAALHALVGHAPIADKMRTLHAIGASASGLFPAVRMMGLNLLHVACTMRAPSADRALLVRYLKDRGVDPSGQSETGLTPLHCLAAQPDGHEVMPYLMGWEGDCTVNVNGRNAAGETPLHIAYATQPDNAPIVAWLRGRGAHVALRTARNETALHAALRHGDHPEVVRDLIACGVGLSYRDATGHTTNSLARQLLRSASWPVIADAAQERSPFALVRPRLGSTEATTVPPPGPMVASALPPAI